MIVRYVPVAAPNSSANALVQHAREEKGSGEVMKRVGRSR